MLRQFAVAAALTPAVALILSGGIAAQDAKAVIASASKAMGADGVSSVTYSGSAANGNFGQSKTIAGPLAVTTISNYTRAIDLAAGVASHRHDDAADDSWRATTPAGSVQSEHHAGQRRLDAAARDLGHAVGLPQGRRGEQRDAPLAAPRRQDLQRGVVVAGSKSAVRAAVPVNGYIDAQNMLERVETWVEHPILGDLLVETTYASYQDFGGLKMPTKIAQKRAGLQTFEATITSAAANPANLTQLMTPPPPAGGAPGAGRGGAPGAPAAAPAVASEKMADGVYRITGGYVALAIEFKDHVVVLEGGQNEARGIAVIAEAKRVIPNKPIRYVVNSHAHFDHGSGLAPFAADGITIITHANNKAYLEKALSGPRTLVGDNLAKANRKPKVESAGDRRVLKDDTHTVELHHIKGLEHSDGMLVAYLPKEKILFTADFNIPAQGQPPAPAIATLIQNIERLKLDFEGHVLVHAPVPDRPITRADLMALAKGTQ